MDKCKTQAEARGIYLQAAQAGEVKDIEWLLQNSKALGLDVNYTDASGLSALNHAIQNGHLVVLYPLLEHGVKVTDDLLRAVEHNFLEAVKLLCEFALHLKDEAEQRRIIDCRCSNDDFNHEVTPIILAAQKNNFNIVKVLLDAGARIPTSRTTSSDNFQRSVGTLALFKGLASNSYVAMESRDPVDRAFTLCNEIRRLSENEIEYRMSYREMETNVKLFATEFISHARSSEEIMTVLSHHDEKDRNNDGDDVTKSPLPKISRALNLKLFEFVAHPNCQQLIITKFYKRLLYLRDKGALYRTMFLGMLLFVYPVLAVLHVYSTRDKFKTFVRIPLVVFIMHLASDLTFVTLLTWEAMSDRQLAHTISFTRRQNFVVLLWIIGMIWQEIECFAAEGVRKVVTNWRRLRNIGIILLFVIGIVFEICATFEAPLSMTSSTTLTTTTDVPLNDHNIAKRSTDTNNSSRTLLKTNFTDGKFSEIGDYVVSELETTNPSINQTTKVQIKEEVVWRVMNYSAKRVAKVRRKPTIPRGTVPVGDETNDYLNLTWNHPQIMGRAFLSLAIAFSVLRMLSYVVISNVFGPLQISLGRMIKGSSHFFIVLGLILGSFAMGLTLTYSNQKITEIQQAQLQIHRVGTFTSVFQSVLSLYWSLFGLMPVEDLQLPGDYVVKETAGSVLYATFYVLIVVVLLNALIAVWSNLYNEIEENSDIQWKFSRTAMWMRYIDNDVRVPPPFNLLPTPRILRRVFRMFAYHPKWTTIEVEDLKPTFDEKWLRIRGLPILIDGRNQVYRQLDKQKSYNRVIDRLRDRYVSEKTGDESSTTIEVTKEDIRNLRNDLISLRYETFQKWLHVHEQFGTTNTDCLHIVKQSDPVTAILVRTGDIGSVLDQNLDTSDVLKSSLCEIETEAEEKIQTLSDKVCVLSEQGQAASAKVCELSQQLKAESAKVGVLSKEARAASAKVGALSKEAQAASARECALSQQLKAASAKRLYKPPAPVAIPPPVITQPIPPPVIPQQNPPPVIPKPIPEPVTETPCIEIPTQQIPLLSTESPCPVETINFESTPADSSLQTVPPPIVNASSTESLDVPCDNMQPQTPTIICRAPSSEAIGPPESPALPLTPFESSSMEEVTLTNDDTVPPSPSERRNSGQSDGGVHNIVVKLKNNLDAKKIKLNVEETARRTSMPNISFNVRKPWQI
ncbi:short transient receptor potential channel 4-like [Asterias rubens]|uniref:short transient receptor potential channel 4-like n=1 Tax=Asterias rubens TaxID=7604 RepID=UPI001455D64E|nr:short transient receptor potential channel 4-like [Asterias rubens]